jgi:hypothetical protein
MAPSEFLGPKHGRQQVHQQQEHNGADQDGWHDTLLQPSAELRVQAAKDEEPYHQRDERDVTHLRPPADAVAEPTRTASLFQYSFMGAQG